MALDNFLKILSLLKVGFELKPVLLDNFFAEIVDQTL